MHVRSCSHTGDESICAAHLLGLDITGILKVDSEQGTQTLYSTLDTFPQQPVFSGNPKIEKVSYRWADEDLAKVRFVRDKGCTVKLGQRQESGLLVQYPGFVFAVDPGEVSTFQDTIYGYDRMGQRWLKFDTAGHLPGCYPGEVVPKMIGVILYHEECTEEGKTKDNPNGVNAVLVAFCKQLDLLSGDAHDVSLLRNTSVTIVTSEPEVSEGFVVLHARAMAAEPPSLPVWLFKFELLPLPPFQAWLVS